MRWIKSAVALAAICSTLGIMAPYQDRFVFIYGWRLTGDNDFKEIRRILEIAARQGFNGVVLSADLDRLDMQPPKYFLRLKEVKRARLLQ